ncbi:MAG: hypothetical protein K8F92_02525 [Hyphomicrobium sp.]|uniref:hypothetical protein n=1 Tax=Hyphomicrobium sp. TaxID=82 RepID=UPI00132100E7|nr:hypothetical protein [Hyphomicrobium sp.]KAB2942546.1 MAG: hypothetical protein F9K20_06035 [Hyphomicrobium sp.]MBZ0208517.1 hypothetical protein [Hyphomicrobium sp.]
MIEIGKILQSPEYWFVAVFTGLIVSVVANFVTTWLPRISVGKPLSIVLTLNILVVAGLIVLGYASTTIDNRFVDFVTAFALLVVYSMAAWLPSKRLRVFALIAPNGTMLALALAARTRWSPQFWEAVVAVYPLAFLIFAVPVMAWAYSALLRWEESKAEPAAR